ncbi:hypothetical protein JZX87_03765 [Agrobacterium sp. Ap1]|uniref:hypothetical protein n=1 Tax=Agrobacterium sp. Ap1 TaxID=2815337 RepID=UPI000FB7EBAE|nr:hypothetical protein [Agrobacterium sp. Ap1]MBO0140282.1 hypothetical protein [Agrobacterium sp. Ap1]
MPFVIRPRRIDFMLLAMWQARHVYGSLANTRRLMKTYDSDKTQTTLRQHIVSDSSYRHSV